MRGQPKQPSKWRALYLLISVGLFHSQSASADTFDLKYRGSISWWNSYLHNPVWNDTSVNPSNRVLKLPQDRFSSEFRPNLKFVSPSLQLIFRPRVRYSLNMIHEKDRDPYERTKVDSFMSEAFAQWTASDAITLALGIQSYQWGAAEVFSPSNRIFHETAQDRTTLFEVRGRYIARLNLSVGKSWSTVIMSEIKENKDNVDIKPFSAEEPWHPTVLIKPEFNWNNGSDYIGMVLGHRNHGGPWLGEYFSYAIPSFEGFTVYADGSHERGSRAWYPQTTSLGPGRPNIVTFERSKKGDNDIKSFVITGVRYDFENGSIARVEYIHNDSAYNSEESSTALSAFNSLVPEQFAVAATNIKRFLAPGLELQGQRLIYVSTFIPNPYSLKDLVFFARGLRSLSDQTTTYYGSAEYTIGDSGTLSYAYSHAIGRRDGELKGFAGPLHIIAYRQDW